MARVVTLTLNPAIDKSARVDQVVPGKKLRCEPPRREPGGGGINVSRALKRFGADSQALYTAGAPTGDILRQLLDGEGIQHRPIAVGGWTRENLTVFEASTEQQYRFGMPGPDLSEEESERCLAELSDLGSETRYLVASGSLPGGVPADFYGRAVRAAERAKLRFVLDTSGEPLCRGAEAGVYLLKPNLRELAELAGESIESESQQQAVAEELVRTGRSEVVVVSAGAAGVLLVTGEVTERIASPTVPIRSRVGAGDSMVAGIVFGLLQDMGIRDAVRYGVAAGAAAVMTPGSELCRPDDTERLLRAMRQPDPN